MLNVTLYILLTALTITGCAPGMVRLDDSDNGRELEVRTGQEIIVSLESNPTTGYTWEISNIEDGIMEQVGKTVFESSTDLVGSGGIQVFRFKACGTGEVVLDLVYHRSWEKEVKPARTFSLKITVGRKS